MSASRRVRRSNGAGIAALSRRFARDARVPLQCPGTAPSVLAVANGGRGSTRERLLDAALEVFGEVGYTGATITEIERRVGLTPGTGSFYRHFPDKAALLQAAVEREVTRVLDDLRSPEWSPASAEQAEATDVTLRKSFAIIRRLDPLFRLMTNEGDRVPEVRTAIEAVVGDQQRRQAWEDDPGLVIGVAALGGYHLFSRFQGGSFQQVPEDAFLGALAALVDTARHDPGRLDRTTTAPYRSENSILTT